MITLRSANLPLDGEEHECLEWKTKRSKKRHAEAAAKRMERGIEDIETAILTTQMRMPWTILLRVYQTIEKIQTTKANLIQWKRNSIPTTIRSRMQSTTPTTHDKDSDKEEDSEDDKDPETEEDPKIIKGIGKDED